MPKPEKSFLLVAGQIGLHNDGWAVRPFLDRLERLAMSVQVVCIDAVGDAASDHRIVCYSGLGRRWARPLTVRALRFGERLLRPDLLHVLQSDLSNVGLAIAEYWRVPYVQTIDEFLPDDARLRLSRHWCRRLIATSREIAADLSTQLGVPPDWIATVNPGVETRSEVAPRSRDRKVAVIGAAGPLVAASGFATFLNAAKHVIDAGVDAEFVVAGQGEDEVDLRRRADRLKIADRVTFAGIPLVGLRFWDVLDLYCQPSLVPSVGRPLATALAFGVPSIASDIEGLRALVTHDRNGLRVAPGDSGALAKAILGLLEDPERANALGKQGQADIARDCHPDAEASGLVAVYREALDPDRVAPSLPALVD